MQPTETDGASLSTHRLIHLRMSGILSQCIYLLLTLALPSLPASASDAKKPVVAKKTAVAEKTTDPKETSVGYTVLVTGSFASLVGTTPTVKLTADDGTNIGTSPSVTIHNSALLTLSYTAVPSSKKPTTLYLNDMPYAYSVVNSSSLPTDQHRLFSGDFCRADTANPPKCRTLLLDNPSTPAQRGTIKGYVSNADRSEYALATVNALTADVADLQYSADANFQPSWITLYKDGNSASPAIFVAAPAKPPVESDVTYEFEDKKCGTVAATVGANGIKINEATKNDPSDSITLKTVSSDALFTHVVGSAPEVITISSLTIKDENKKDVALNCIARIAAVPSDTGSPLDIIFNIEDQETVHQDFGPGIAEHFVAVRLDVSNRSSKKLQFNKSAIWFDVDYRQSSRKNTPTGRQFLAAMTVDLIPINAYDAPSSTHGKCQDRVEHGKAPATPCREYRFGIEQDHRVSPINYSTTLNVYDSHSERIDRALRAVELFGSVLSTIATGGAVAQVHNSAFKDSATILTSNFLPGYRSIIQDTEGTNRKRANLVGETLQDAVQIPGHGHVTTMVLLPRDAMLQMMNYEELVVIDRVLNVHIDPDVLNSVASSVPKNQVEVGYTKDQVREAIGEPTTVTTNADGTSKFTYTTGPYSEVDFDKDGKVTATTPRSLSDQLEAAATEDDALKVLRDNSLNSTALVLLNGNRLLADINGVNKTLQYDPSGKHIGDYTLLYSDISGFVNKTINNLQTELAAKNLGAKTDSYKWQSTSNNTATYAMPDIQGGTITVTVNGSTVLATSTITKINFEGTKAASALNTSQ